MTFPPRLAIASRNAGKIREILAICADWPVAWLTAEGDDSTRWPIVEETGTTYLENAALKAVAVAGALGVPAVADDSGIEVDALDGAPGVISALYAGEGASDRENLDKLIDALRSVPEPERTGRYRCVALTATPEGAVVHAEATCEGRLVTDPRGSNGFGYDPVFVAEGETRTMAELSPGEKDRISHRGKAFRALRELLDGDR